MSRLYRKFYVKNRTHLKMKIFKIPADKSLQIWIVNFCHLEFLIFSFLKEFYFFYGNPDFFHELVYFQQLLKNLHLKLWYLQNNSKNLTSRHIGYSEKITSLLYCLYFLLYEPIFMGKPSKNVKKHTILSNGNVYISWYRNMNNKLNKDFLGVFKRQNIWYQY